jgi:hypothetical protein
MQAFNATVADLVLFVRFSMINKVATTHCSFLGLQIKREDISTNAVSVTKTELYTILRDVCIVSRGICIVSNRLTCIDSKLSEMEILAQPLSLPFIIENLNYLPTQTQTACNFMGHAHAYTEMKCAHFYGILGL